MMSDADMPEDEQRACHEVTCILNSLEAGKGDSADLLPLIYEQLRRLARRKMAGEAPGATLQATALVHEAYLRLANQKSRRWESRGHFYVAASESMRRILVERARYKAAQKRGGPGKVMVDIELVDVACAMADEEVLRVDEALEKLEQLDKPAADLIRLRFFVGLSHPEAADVLGISERSAKRIWAYARGWLYDEIKSGSGGECGGEESNPGVVPGKAQRVEDPKPGA